MKRRLGTALLAVGLLASSACSQEHAGAGMAQRHLFVVAEGKKVTGPDRIDARAGDPVQIVVTADTADELHVHGYDRSAALVAGRPSTLDLVADVTGVFEVELHESGVPLTWLRVAR